jgi:GNAT superfamily N-acetyltransferase
MLRGLERINATTIVLQRARLADPLRGFWEAADVQWWWARPRASDELALPVWFDDAGPVAAAGLTSSKDEGPWQTDVFVVPSTVSPGEIWAETMRAADEYAQDSLEMLVHDTDTTLTNLARRSGFKLTDERMGTSWMDPEQRRPIRNVSDFTIADRTDRADRPHPMIARNGEHIEQRLQQCSLYDPTLDLSAEDTDGNVAGYALFWLDHTTSVGLLEPMRVHEEYQRRGLAHMLLTNGVDRLVRRGARRLKVGFAAEAVGDLYRGGGFVQTSVDRLLTRSAR